MEDPAARWRCWTHRRERRIVNTAPRPHGFADSTNDFAARYASPLRARLLPLGGVHPRFTTDRELMSNR